MSILTVNINKTKHCAFCKHWYDPTNSGILPRVPSIGLWQILDTNQKCLCLKKNIQRKSHAFCDHFELKL